MTPINASLLPLIGNQGCLDIEAEVESSEFNPAPQEGCARAERIGRTTTPSDSSEPTLVDLGLNTYTMDSELLSLQSLPPTTTVAKLLPYKSDTPNRASLTTGITHRIVYLTS